MTGDRIMLISGNSNPLLAAEISEHLCGREELCCAHIGRFADGEIEVHIKESVRGADVFVIQSTSPPVNENLMELLLIIDALKRASAGRITAVIPYFGYARQDRKFIGRVPISAKLIANLIETAGANRVLTIELHAGQIQGFFDIPVDNLKIHPIIAKYFAERGLTHNAVVVSPDVGGARRARAVAEELDLPLAIVEKSRKGKKVEVMNLIGDVEGKRAIIVDDIIATGGTVGKAIEVLRCHGALRIYAAFIHGVFAPGALKNIEDLEKVVVTNTIPIPQSNLIEVISVGKELAQAIERIHENRSVSELFPLGGW